MILGEIIMDNNYVLAMYDVCGIQNYIFKTTKLKDAIGASYIIENIIEDALMEGAKRISNSEKHGCISCNFDLANGNLSNENLNEYEDNKYDIQVLYIGGGNGVVIYSSKELCVDMNKLMSMYVLNNTYSLQLAVAFVEKTENYGTDYNELYKELAKVKANKEASRPLNILPVMKIEKKTGNPITDKTIRDENGKYQNVSTESWLKKSSEQKKRQKQESQIKIFDNYALEKGADSTIAIVHMDGNNMGLRIRSLLENKESYVDAVSQMRKISGNINNSYKAVYDEMETLFTTSKKRFMLPVLVAGDDITYVCTGKVALASVEYFSREISKRTMNGPTDEGSINKYGFTVCAGIAYINSHFPFSVGYDIAEACCESAKDKAKENAHLYENGKVGNWVDFHICKNIYAKELEDMRHDEYFTCSGENLLIRPYELDLGNKELKSKEIEQYNNFVSNISFFGRENKHDNAELKTIPRSLAKRMRNTYSLGRTSIEQLSSFLKSREYRMPDNTNNMYENDSNTALWYDSLEMLDNYISLEEIEKIED